MINGSNVIEVLWQSGHVTFDLYCPVIISVIIDWFLFVWTIQLSYATMLSSLLLLYICSTVGFFFTLFKSSWSPSTINEKNYCESCWEYPWNKGLIDATADFREYGENID